jgi:hypothetical protein
MPDPEAEVRRLHEVIEGWFAGTVADLAPFADAMDGTFRIVSPDGEPRTRGEVVRSMREAKGVHAGSDPPFEIAIRDVDHRTAAGGYHLVTYEEHQRVDGDWEGRTSSAWLREREHAPAGLVWVHLQETWLD